MRSIRRFSALLLAVLLLFAATSCLSAEEKQNQTVIGTCAGTDVLYEELRYVALTYREIFESTYGKGIWEDPASAETYRGELEATVWDMMLNNYAVLAACAYYLPGYTIEEKEIQKAVDEQIEETRSAYESESDYLEALEAYHLTEHFLRFTIAVAQLENELFYVLTDDLGLIFNEPEPFMDWLDEGNFVCVQHIFIQNDPGDDPAANRAAAENVRDGLKSGKNISEYINSSVNEDLTNTAPYFLVRDVYTKELETAAFALNAPGDVSDVVETETGYYILQRQSYSDATLAAQAYSLLSSYQWAKVESFIEPYREKITLELNDYGKSLDLLEIR